MNDAIGAPTAVNNNNAYYYENALTPDALMIYLTTRLEGVDEQIQSIFKRQQEADKARGIINDLRATLNNLDVDANKDKVLTGASPQLQELKDTLTQLERVNPTLAEAIETTLSGKNYVLHPDDQGGNTYAYTTTEVENTETYLDNVVSDLESTSQMNMINLQSLMSGRQTAISLSTNLISKLSESTQKVVDNIR